MPAQIVVICFFNVNADSARLRLKKKKKLVRVVDWECRDMRHGFAMMLIVNGHPVMSDTFYNRYD